MITTVGFEVEEEDGRGLLLLSVGVVVVVEEEGVEGEEEGCTVIRICRC